MLAYSQGGANTPSTSAATVQPEDALSTAVHSAASKALQTASVENLQQQNKILEEKWAQEKIATDNMRTKYVTSGDQGVLDAEINLAKDTAEQTRWQAKLAKTNSEIRDIEKQIMADTQLAQVSSAKNRAELLDTEISLNQMKAVLMELDIPEKEAMAKWFTDVGEASPAAKAFMTISQWLRFMFGGNK